ncbi:hypothetical protein DSO57_1015965 [Entomophthora muscae]|uniref:Uncharacterized protein n=1 Tax=Entomophthora muscae TaxID=34485 RepID=A0ACC2T5U9_9FUNG|nr:hypothetical protein DSO57_1015965 [Entomophthora muscae]
MASTNSDFFKIIPVAIFGTLAIFTTVFLEYKLKEFREEKKRLKSLKDEIEEKERVGVPKVLIDTEESETSAHETSNPDKLSSELEDRHVLFVCMRCTHKKTTCAGLEDCKLGLNNENKTIEQDVEDLGDSGEDKPQIKPGAVLYHKLVQAHGLQSSPTRKFRKQFEIRPTRCLSTCDEGASIALQGPNTKFGYQFKQLDPKDPTLVDDILEFSSYYVESSDGYSKSKTRPSSLKSTIASRIPPKNHYSTA